MKEKATHPSGLQTSSKLENLENVVTELRERSKKLEENSRD